jgi:uncharacterized membrane protein
MARAEGQPPAATRGSWTLKDVVQGKPIRRPTHPIFVMFPIVFFVGALATDILSRLGLSGAARAGTWAVIAGLVGAAFAIPTGLVDRSQMRPGSRIRGVATRHMTIQLSAVAIFLIDLAVRLGAHPAKARPLWLVLDVIGTIVIIVGGDVGGQMVFRMGYRVGEGTERDDVAQPGRAAPPAEAPPATTDPVG